MKQILVITRTFREAVEDMRTLQGWILKYTVFKMGIEPHRGRITTEHAEVIFVSAQIEENFWEDARMRFAKEHILTTTYENLLKQENRI